MAKSVIIAVSAEPAFRDKLNQHLDSIKERALSAWVRDAIRLKMAVEQAKGLNPDVTPMTYSRY